MTVLGPTQRVLLLLDLVDIAAKIMDSVRVYIDQALLNSNIYFLNILQIVFVLFNVRSFNKYFLAEFK